MSNRVVVVGAGVVGLTCAVRLAEAGIPTDVIAADLPPETTSAVAGAVWLPTVGTPTLRHWAKTTVRELISQVQHDVGVTVRTGVLLGPADAAAPSWSGLLTEVGLPDPERVSEPFGAATTGAVTTGWRASVPVVDPERYLAWLTARFEAAGGSITRMALSVLPERGTVVNATGFRAKWLARDDALTPTRGIVALVRNPGIEGWWYSGADRSDLRYAIPRNEHLVAVGGTYEPEELLASVEAARGREVLDRAAAIDPRLAGADLVGVRVGIRPVRHEPRVELVTSEQRRVVHCYGHGGNGWALSWGTANEVLGLLGQNSLF